MPGLSLAQTIQIIKERIPVEELAREAGLQLRQEGNEFKSPCPFHKDTDPSFSIFTGDDGHQRFQCFGCQAKGDVIDFYALWRNVDAATARRELGARAGAEPTGSDQRRPPHPRTQRQEKPEDGLAGYPPAQPKEESSMVLPGGLVPTSLADGVLERQTAALHRHPEVLQFLQEKRRLSAEIIQRARLGYDERRERIIIPMMGPDGTVVRSRLYDWQKKAKGAKMIWSEGSTVPRLYPFWALEHDELLLVAGEMDCLAAWSLGIPAITGTGGEEKWGRQFSKPLAGKRVIICYDLDPEGQKGAQLVAVDLVKVATEVRVLNLPLPWRQKGDPKDLTDWITAGGTAEQLRELIARAPALPKPAKSSDEDEEDLEPAPVLSRLPDAPVSEEALLPFRWLVNARGVFEPVFREGKKSWRQVVATPIVITERTRNLDTDVESLRLAFQRDGRWRSITAERDTVADKGRIVRLSNRGLLVTSNTSSRLVQYLADYETVNLTGIPEQAVVSVSGFRSIPGLQLLYVIGSHLLRAEDGTDDPLGPDLRGDESTGTPEGPRPPVMFQPEAEGDNHLVAALRQRGSFEIWRDMVVKLRPFPRVMFCLYASCAAALLNPCEAPNFIIDLAGDTSRGKTTLLEILASVWGLPAGHQGGLVKSWNQTKVFAERYATLFNDLPIFFDDSQTSDSKTVAATLYQVANGIGRGRGAAKGGVQKVTHWRTICFSTGEQPLTSNTEFGGARARVLTLWGSPFGDEPQGELVREIKAVVARHYGHLGPRIVRLLLQMERGGEWDGLQELYLDHVRRLAMMFPGNLTDRLSRYVGLVWVAAYLVHSILHLEWSADETIMAVMSEVSGEVKAEGDYATRALEAVKAWAHASVIQFVGKEDSLRPPAEYLGVWRDFGDNPADRFVAFYPQKLRAFLTKEGFSYQSVLRQWRDRGWIKTERGRMTYGVRVREGTPKLVVIPIVVWDDEGVTPGADSPIVR